MIADSSKEVACFNCKAGYDPLPATWCSCLTKESSLTCPHCQDCFCKAPARFKQTFWSNASPTLWERKLARAKGGGGASAESQVDVTRPLILVVDDEEEIRSIARQVIDSLGYRVIVARNGEEGLAMARTHNPDLVLTDAMMPRLDGREMALAIKNDPATSSIKVVIMTSLYTAPRYRHEGLRTFRADEYLSKPIDIQILRATLHRFLG